MENCKICGNYSNEVIYCDKIRKGAFGNFTKQEVEMYQCKKCGVIWHPNINEDIENYYDSEAYRIDMAERGGAKVYYQNHDGEVLEKLQYTGTNIFRDKKVADIGCGGGSFLDFILGVSQKTIGIEPSNLYKEDLVKKGHTHFSYVKDALVQFKGQVEVVTSFDVLEHVDDPVEFLKEINELCVDGAQLVIGTPSEQPIMRNAMGGEYESFLFSYQHPWIFNEESLKIMFEQAGFREIEIQYKQRYGLANLIMWLTQKRPTGNTEISYISKEMETLWKKDAERNKMADYLIVYAKK